MNRTMMRDPAEEPQIYPLDLLEDCRYVVGQGEPDPRQWWAFHTRPRQEKCLARDLRLRQIPFYLPLVKRRVLVRNRPVYSMVPLFSGYVFVCASREERLQGLRTNRVAQVLQADNAESLVNDLRYIQSLIRMGAPLTVEARMAPGQLVRVRTGALEGIEGILVRRKRETRLVVAVHLLQQGVSLEIDDYLLEPV